MVVTDTKELKFCMQGKQRGLAAIGVCGMHGVSGVSTGELGSCQFWPQLSAHGAGATALEGLLSARCLLGCWGDPKNDLPRWRRRMALPAWVWPSTAFLRTGYAVPWWPERRWLPCPGSHLSPHPSGITAWGVPGWNLSPAGMRLGAPGASWGWQAATAGPGAHCCRGGVRRRAAELALMAFVSFFPGSAAVLPA